MKRLLLDLNILPDVILDRQPHADVAAALWAAIERGLGHGMLPAHGVTTIFYILEKAKGTARVCRAEFAGRRRPPRSERRVDTRHA